MCGVMRAMHRTKEVEADKEENANLGLLDQTPHVSFTLGESFCPILHQSWPCHLEPELGLTASVFGIIRQQLRLHHLTYQVPWSLLLALKALPGPTVLHGETDPQSFSPSCSAGQPKAGRELRDVERTDIEPGAPLPATNARAAAPFQPDVSTRAKGGDIATHPICPEQKTSPASKASDRRRRGDQADEDDGLNGAGTRHGPLAASSD